MRRNFKITVIVSVCSIICVFLLDKKQILEKDLRYVSCLPKYLLPKDCLNFTLDKSNELLETGISNAAANVRLPVESQSYQMNASWVQFQSNISMYNLYRSDSPIVDTLLRDMATMPILAAEEVRNGTQLKLRVTFKDGSKAIMKFNALRHVDKDNAHRDQHFSEITSFHVDRVLGYNRIPPAVGRLVNIETELKPAVSSYFRDRMSTLTDGRVCFYGHCYFCSAKDPICGTPQNIEVSLSHYIPYPLVNVGSVLFRNRKQSNLEMRNWCDEARSDIAKGGKEYLDYLDILHFDILIGNHDRHTYEYFQYFYGYNDSKPILMDHGKSFNHNKSNEMLGRFLSKERRCCLMKRSTFLKFVEMSQGPNTLSKIVNDSLKADPLYPVLSRNHLLEMDARLNKIVSVILECIDNSTLNDVIINDMIQD